MTAPQTSTGGGMAGTLQEKLGPLKTWQWLAIITVAILGWVLWQKHKNGGASTSSTTTGSTTSNYAGEQQIPQFIIQNQMPTSEPTTTATTPPATKSSAPNIANGFYRDISTGNIYEVANGKRYYVSLPTWKKYNTPGAHAPKVTQVDNTWQGFQLPKQSTSV